MEIDQFVKIVQSEIDDLEELGMEKLFGKEYTKIKDPIFQIEHCVQKSYEYIINNEILDPEEETSV